ncbi:MAG: RNA polymerase sigma factor [Methylococcales bacterium]|nr:RNA polymerase sigma factor [Methylococcales bacterium]
MSHPHPFLFQIARNLAFDYLRKQKVRQRDYSVDLNFLDSESTVVNVPVVDLTPEQEAIDQQEFENLLKSLEDLTERRRQILVLNKIHHWKYERIAQHFGISRSEVLAHKLSRASKH